MKPQYTWSVNWRDAKGNTMGMSNSRPENLLEEALRFNAVAITLHRESKIGKLPTLKEVQQAWGRKDA
jgi:hypothetical protein